MCLPAYTFQVVEQGESKSEFLQNLSSCKHKWKLRLSKVLQQDSHMDWDTYMLNLGWNMGKGNHLCAPSLPLWLQIDHKNVKTVSLRLNTYVLLKGSFLPQFSLVLHHVQLWQGKCKKNSRSWHLARSFVPQVPQYLTLYSGGYACIMLPQLLGNLVLDYPIIM